MWLGILVNNPDNGVDTGYVEAFDFAAMLHLHGLPLRCTVDTTRLKVRISRRLFSIEKYDTWVGNWCWDAMEVSLETASQIAEYVRSTGKYNCEGGETSLFNAWHVGGPIVFTAHD
jgi:hypothetical protein